MAITVMHLGLTPVERAQADSRSGSLERAVSDACPKGRLSCMRFPGCGGTCPRPRAPLQAPANDTYTRRGRR